MGHIPVCSLQVKNRMTPSLIVELKHTKHPVAHLTWKKGDCCVRAAFDLTFQHKIAFSLETRNQPMNFAMLPKYHHIAKILPIYSISAIFAYISCNASFLHRVFRNPSYYFASDQLT